MKIPVDCLGVKPVAEQAVSHEARLRRFVLLAIGGLVGLAFVPEISFWISAGLLAYTYIAYPLLLASLAVFRRKRVLPAQRLPSVSILIAACNEEGAIAQTVSNALNLNYPKDRLEVVVVSDGSTDGTNAILAGISDPRLRWLPLPTQCGKTQAQNEAIRLCRGEVVVFSDATTIYHRDAIRHLVRHYRDPQVGAVSGHYEYLTPDAGTSAVLGTAVFWRFENLIKRLQSRAGTITNCSGCIYSVRRSLYTPLHPQSCSDLVEPLALIRKGYRVVFEPEALAFETCSTSIGQEFRMRVRVAAHGIDSIAANADLLDIFRHGWVALQLISHKVLRWMTPLFLINVFAMSALLMFREPFRMMFLAQLVFYGLSLALAFAPRRGRWRMIGIPFQFCALHAAVVVGLTEAISGKVYTFWQPARD